MLRSLFGLLLVAGSAHAAPTFAVIWGGGPDEAAAQTSLERWREDSPTLSKSLRLAEGFPKVVASSDVPGLKPGFQVVLLGFCKQIRGADALAWLRSIYPSVYVRKIQRDEPDSACPTVTAPRQLLSVAEKGRWGFVDQEGRWVVPARFSKVDEFSEGLAFVQDGATLGAIDRTGKMVLKLNLKSILPACKPRSKVETAFEPFKAGLGRISVDCDGWTQSILVDRQGRRYDEPVFSEGVRAVGIERAGAMRYGYENDAGAVVIDYQYDWAGPFSEGIAWVTQKGHDLPIDHSGKVLFQPAQPLVEVEALEGGQSSAGTRTDAGTTKYGVVDKTGRWVVEPKFDEIGSKGDGLRAACLPTGCGYLDQTGAFAIPPQFAMERPLQVWTSFKSGSVRVVRADGGIGIIRADGEPAVPGNFDKVVCSDLFGPGNCLVVGQKKEGVVNKSGWVVPLDFSRCTWRGDGSFEVESQTPNGKRVGIWAGGKLALAPEKLVTLSPPIGKRWIGTGVDKKQGLYELSGRVVLEPIYDLIKFGSETRIAACKDKQCALFDADGKQVAAPTPWEPHYLFQFGPDDRASIKTSAGFGYIDQTGKVVIAAGYNEVQRFSEGLAAVRPDPSTFVGTLWPSDVWDAEDTVGRKPVREGHFEQKWGYINRRGELVIKPQFGSAQEFKDGFAPVEAEGGVGFIDRTGRILFGKARNPDSVGSITPDPLPISPP